MTKFCRAEFMPVALVLAVTALGRCETRRRSRQAIGRRLSKVWAPRRWGGKHEGAAALRRALPEQHPTEPVSDDACTVIGGPEKRCSVLDSAIAMHVGMQPFDCGPVVRGIDHQISAVRGSNGDATPKQVRSCGHGRRTEAFTSDRFRPKRGLGPKPNKARPLIWKARCEARGVWVVV